MPYASSMAWPASLENNKGLSKPFYFDFITNVKVKMCLSVKMCLWSLMHFDAIWPAMNLVGFISDLWIWAPWAAGLKLWSNFKMPAIAMRWGPWACHIRFMKCVASIIGRELFEPVIFLSLIHRIKIVQNIFSPFFTRWDSSWHFLLLLFYGHVIKAPKTRQFKRWWTEWATAEEEEEGGGGEEGEGKCGFGHMEVMHAWGEK